ncbi:MAG: hypothetical protein JHC93_01670 [Parachlamydiales bacterium]|nr:hypothetical protein [Parachlamydiales bacterium]
MFKFSHKNLVIMAGVTWLVIGVFLLTLGLKFIGQVATSAPGHTSSFLPAFANYFGSKEIAATGLIAAALLIGYFKSRFVLSKSVHRVVNRIKTLSNPAPLYKLYNPSYFLIIGVMMGLGMMMKYLNVPMDLRGAIDVAVGAALVNGATMYFRKASHINNKGTVVQ